MIIGLTDIIQNIKNPNKSIKEKINRKMDKGEEIPIVNMQMKKCSFHY